MGCSCRADGRALAFCSGNWTGKSYWRVEGFSTVDLVKISSFLYWKYDLPLYKTSYLNEDVNCTEPTVTTTMTMLTIMVTASTFTITIKKNTMPITRMTSTVMIMLKLIVALWTLKMKCLQIKYNPTLPNVFLQCLSLAKWRIRPNGALLLEQATSLTRQV
jgi:hypothetical protein